MASVAISKAADKLQDIHYVYDNVKYFIPSSELQEYAGIVSTLLCLAPFVLPAIIVAINTLRKFKDIPVTHEVIPLLQLCQEYETTINIYQLTDQQLRESNLITFYPDDQSTSG